MNTSNTKTLIGARSFDAADQENFARLSLDRNPMHMDPVAARRMLTGHAVVHGMHVVLCALDLLAKQVSLSFELMTCTFDNAVNVGDHVDFFLDQTDEDEWRMDARVNGLLSASVKLRRRLEGAANNRLEPQADLPRCSDVSPNDVTGLHVPLDIPPTEQVGRTYVINPQAPYGAHPFPRICEQLGQERVGALCSLSYFVGMVCPGLNSIFGSLQVNLTHPASSSSSMLFHVRKFDERMRIFEVAFVGPVSGTLRAFSRPPPHTQPSFHELLTKVTRGEFDKTSSLVIGGSRGLGELTAKCIAAGGGSVAITYATGGTDADRVCAEINEHARTLARSVKWDAASESFESLDLDWPALDAVYYYATPRIYRKKANVYDPELFAEFCAFYVNTFFKMCAFLESIPTTKPVRIFLPSTVFTEERPKGMTEYAMAKAAAELLAQDMNRTFRRARVYCERLPRMDTDQTLSLLKSTTSPALATILGVIRSVQGRCD